MDLTVLAVFEYVCVCLSMILCVVSLLSVKWIRVTHALFRDDLYVTKVWLPITLNGQFLHILFKYMSL